MFWNRVWDFGKEKSWLILINTDQYWSILIRNRYNSCFETESDTLVKKNPDQYWSILINIDQYRSVLIRNRHNSCFETEFETLVKKIPDQYWSILINIDQYWSGLGVKVVMKRVIIVVLKQSLRLCKKSPDQYWSILIYIDQYWSILINIDLYWSILINIDLYWSETGIIVVLKQSLRLWLRKVLINIDQYRSILIRTRHNSCFETESETLVKKNPDLINIDQYWSET